MVLFTSCHGSSDARRDAVDSLNSVAYAWRYRDVERSRQITTETLAQAEADGYAAGQAEALNHLAYERFWVMDFDSAMALAQKVIAMKATSVEKIAAHVMAMKVAQRTSQNVAFFAHRSQAEQLLAKTYRRDLNPHELSRLDFAEGEMHIVASTYFFYVDQLERAQAEIAEAEHYCQMAADTAQWLYYNYMLGSGGLIESADDDDVTRQEFDHL